MLKITGFTYFIPLSSPKAKHKCIKDMKSIIMTKSNSVYKIFHTEDEKLTPADLRIKQRCCNFDLLEQMCITYANKDTN